jgi:ketosteroid isomerase-like protein
MSPSDIATQLLAADEARYQALYAQDVAALAPMLRDDYLHTHATGKTDEKIAFLATIQAGKYRFLNAVRSDQVVRSVGTVAFLSGTTETTIEIGGTLKTLRNAFVTAWVLEEGAWKLLHWQATKLAEG